jgi:hypothetical protein
MRKELAAAFAAVLLLGSAMDARAQVSDDVVKIGVLDDMSGLYADIQGPGDVVAGKMAVEDFGGTVNGKPIEVIFGRPPEQGRCRQHDRAPLVRHREGGRRSRSRQFGGRAGGPGHRPREEQGCNHDVRRNNSSDREGLLAQRNSLIQGVIFVTCVLTFRRGVVGEIAHYFRRSL